MLPYEERTGLITAASVTRSLGIRKTKLGAQLFKGVEAALALKM